MLRKVFPLFISNSKYRKALSYLLTFAIPALGAIAFVNHETDRSMRTEGSYHTHEWKAIYEGELNADILMLGSSRAWVHLNPRIFDSVTGLSSYNLGMDAYSIDFQLDRFWAAIHHNLKPKWIIQNMDALTLRRSGYVDYNKLQFLPYLCEPELRDDLIANGLSWQDRYLPLFKYRGQRDQIKAAFRVLKGDTLNISPKYKGFQGQDKTWSTEFAEFKKTHDTYAIAYDTEMIERLDEMLHYCAQHDISVVLAHLPLYDELTAMIQDKHKLDSLMYSFEKKYKGCYYVDDATTTFSGDTQFFYNATHMNARGADSISLKLARFIATKENE